MNRFKLLQKVASTDIKFMKNQVPVSVALFYFTLPSVPLVLSSQHVTLSSLASQPLSFPPSLLLLHLPPSFIVSVPHLFLYLFTFSPSLSPASSFSSLLLLLPPSAFLLLLPRPFSLHPPSSSLPPSLPPAARCTRIVI